MNKKTFFLSAIVMSMAVNVAVAHNQTQAVHSPSLSHDGTVQWRVDDRPDYNTIKSKQRSVSSYQVQIKKKTETKKKHKRKAVATKNTTKSKQETSISSHSVTGITVKQTISAPQVNKTQENKSAISKNIQPAHRWKKPVLALDSGYSINDPGMSSVRGKREVEYNDRFVKELIPRIQAAGWEVRLTRGEHPYISDKHRAEQANIWEADLLLSIHHDVSPKRYLKSEIKDGVTVTKSTQSFEGYSMYLSKKNKKYRASLCFAQRLGFRLKPLQRSPAYFHKEYEGLPLIMKEYGIYERDVPILRDAQIPAVQVKIGVVTDPQDEAWINDDQYRRDIENAVIKTIRVFKQYCSSW